MTPSPRTSETPNLRALVAMEADILSQQSKLDAARAKFKEKLARIAQSYGAPVVTVPAQPLVAANKNGHAKAKGKTSAVSVKYRDPRNPANTWSGRGRPARWLSAALKVPGTKREDFRVGT